MIKYEDYIRSPEWFDLRERAFDRDGRRCVLCNSPKDLRGHHRTYERLGSELVEDIATLCKPCHDLYSAATSVTPPRDTIPIPLEPTELDAQMEAHAFVESDPEVKAIMDAYREASESGDMDARDNAIRSLMSYRRGQ
jgi:hypothetical protein